VNPYLDYQNFLRSLEELRTIASTTGLPVEDLLTAQGYMWLITKWDPRTVLAASEIATFRAWRGDLYTGASFEATQAFSTTKRDQEDCAVAIEGFSNFDVIGGSPIGRSEARNAQGRVLLKLGLCNAHVAFTDQFPSPFELDPEPVRKIRGEGEGEEGIERPPVPTIR
jgi:hypothetical protein